MSARPLGFWLLLAAGVAVVATVVAAVAVMGTPDAQRRMRQDERRIRDLDRIVDVARIEAREHGRLPASLDVLAKRPGRLTIRDPFTDAPYEYRVVDARSFQVCATFETDSATDIDDGPRWVASEWQHPAGRHCFDRVLETDK